MDISDYGVSPNADPIVQDLVKYDLLKHAVELKVYGMTVVPPEKMGDETFGERLRNAILRTYEKRNGKTIDDYTTDAPDPESVRGNSWYLLQEDEAFVEAATNPRMLTLLRWICGQSVCLTGQNWIIKPPTQEEVDPNASVGLHSDAHGIPPGGGHIAHVANASWLCTDYNGAEDGPTVFVPGSHQYGRATLPHESAMGLGDDSPWKVFPLIGKAGSLALWHGATWHGTTPRTNPGLRITLVQVFMRMHMRPIHMWDDVSPQLMEKYPQLQRVLGEHTYPFRENVERPETVAPFMATGTDPYA